MTGDDNTALRRENEELRRRIALLEADPRLAPAVVSGAGAARSDDEGLRLLVERSPYCIHRIDAQQQLISMNRAGLQMMGVEAESEIIGMDYVAAVGERDRPRIAALLARAYQGESAEFEFEAVNGRIFKSFFIPLTVVDGRITQIMGLTQDITEAEQTLHELRASQELNRRITEALPGGYLRVDAEGRFVEANTTAMEILDIGPDDLGRAKVADFGERTLWEDGTPCGVEDYVVTRALATGQPQSPVTMGMRRADGELSWAVYTAVPVIAEEGTETVGAVVTCLDLTERKQAEAERAKFEAKLLHAQKLESLGILAGGIAHDFNNLLVGVLGNAELAAMLLEGEVESPVLTAVQRIEEAALRAAELTKQLLAYSGGARLSTEAISLSEVAEGMVDLLLVSIPKSVQLERTLAAQLPAIDADPTQIRQVVMNLVTNGAESMEGGEGQLSIATRLTRVRADDELLGVDREAVPPGEYVELEVRDTGRGMSPETLARIFDPFYTTKVSGRGLGLSAVLGIIRAHRGILRVQSELGRGTAFSVLFPPIEAPVRAPRSGRRVARGSTVWPRGGTVLVVDDETVVRDVAARTLRSRGFEVLQARDGQEGVETFVAHADRIDAVLMDVMMPRLGGKAAMEQIRALRPGIPVVLSSGYTEERADLALPADGTVIFLEKPYGPSELARALSSVLPPDQ